MAYNPSSIKVLKGLDGVRKRPAMYIGSVDVDGYHHLIWEIVDNSIDEAIAGHCSTIRITIDSDEQTVTVEDNGRGIPTKTHPTEKIPTVDVVMTILHAGGKFDHEGYKVSGGLHGVGASVVNALSDWMEVSVRRQGKLYFRRYEKAEPTTAKLKVTKSKRGGTGTKIQFKPNHSVFVGCKFEKARVLRRMRELAFLNQGLKITLDWKEGGKVSQSVFQSQKGLDEYVDYLVNGRQKLHDIIRIKGKNVAGCEVDIAFVFDEKYESSVHSFCNNIATREGGVHHNAALDSLCKVVADLAEQQNLLKDVKIAVNKADVMEGLNMVISVLVPDPQFGGQTKTKLGNRDLRGPLGAWFYKQMGKEISKNKTTAKTIATKIVEAMKARDAARKAKTLSRKKSLVGSLGLPGKLADCSSREPHLCEIYIVEGDSAGGTAKDARDRDFQAVLPLRGKVLNVSKASLNRTLENKEIGTLISALGVNLTDHDVDLSSLRYHKIILMADADPDGGHICCLLLAFFHRYMSKLIKAGHLYVCDLPLYAVKHRGKTRYLKDDSALEEFRKQHKDAKMEVSRFKGLGEMDVDELEETAMDLSTRRLKQVFIGDDIESKMTLEALMGASVKGRKEFLATELNFES